MALLSTPPSTQVAQSTSASSARRTAATPAPPTVLLGLLPGVLPPAKASHDSSSSTRATSPSSSVASSDDVRKQPGNSGSDGGVLARRRGRGILMLSELVLEVDAEKPGRSPSDESTSSYMVGGNSSRCTNSTRCTPSTPQMMSFSPPKAKGSGSNAGLTKLASEMLSSSGAGAPEPQAGAPEPQCCRLQGAGAPEPCPATLTNQVAGRSMMHISPVQKSADASQRSTASAGALGGAAAGGDASRRQPVGRMTLGIAVIGGDASQRCPPGVPPRMPDTIIACDASQRGLPGSSAAPRACPAPKPPMPRPLVVGAQETTFHRTPVASGYLLASQGPLLGSGPLIASEDLCASQGPLLGSGPLIAAEDGADLTAGGCSDAIQSWMASGPFSNGSQMSAMDVVEHLRAAAPESYED